MHSTFQYPHFPYRPAPEATAPGPVRHPVVVIGGGPVGLSAALDCARHGLRCVLLDDNDTVSVGSRAVCYAKRPLEFWDRLGVARGLVAQGVRWQVGKVFFGDGLVWRFDLLPEPGHQMPAMINLQQYHLETALVEACGRGDARGLIDLRWKHRLVGLQQQADHVRLTVDTPDGPYPLEADWVIACDGAHSDTRRLVGAGFSGQAFQDRFLIADVVMKTDAPPGPDGAGLRRLGAEPERWFWFDPPFHRGQSVLLHRQADDVWRIDFQLGWQADPDAEKQPERVIPRIRAMLGEHQPFELEWVSIYQFACRRIDRFRHGRVLFAGDSAHQVSPFGARGANSGVQDIDNLVWKLARVQRGQSPEALLDSYHDERALAADDNLRHSTRATDFITPKSRASRRLRDAVLQLAADEPFARSLVNSGRLSTPTPYADSPLNTPDADTGDLAFAGAVAPGQVAPDAPLRRAAGAADAPVWLLAELPAGFSLLVYGAGPAIVPPQDQGRPLPVLRIGAAGEPGVDLVDVQGLFARRFDARPGSVWLMRPDQHLAARWRRYDAAQARAALDRACGRPAPPARPATPATATA